MSSSCRLAAGQWFFEQMAAEKRPDTLVEPQEFTPGA